MPAANLAIQNQGLESNRPDRNLAVESNYGTDEIPCAMNALDHTRIGYQSGGTSIVTGADKTAFLQAIANGPAYGAQYIELIPGAIDAFVENFNGITFNGVSNYGTTELQNIDMLSRTFAAAETVMATNSSNSSSGTLCPLPEVLSVSGTTVYSWTYP